MSVALQLTAEWTMTSSVVRQLQIDMITDTPNPIIDWFNDLWSNLHVVQANVYHDRGNEFIYYKIKHDMVLVIFYQDKKSYLFTGHYKYYWSILQDKFKLKYPDVQEVTKLLVESVMGTSILTTPRKIWSQDECIVSNALKHYLASPRTLS